MTLVKDISLQTVQYEPQGGPFCRRCRPDRLNERDLPSSSRRQIDRKKIHGNEPGVLEPEPERSKGRTAGDRETADQSSVGGLGRAEHRQALVVDFDGGGFL